MPAGVAYSMIMLMKLETLLTNALICVAKVSTALEDWEEYSMHIELNRWTVPLALLASQLANLRVEGLAGCPLLSARWMLGFEAVESLGAAPPVRCISSICEARVSKSRARCAARFCFSSLRYSWRFRSARFWAMAGITSRTSDSMLESTCAPSERKERDILPSAPTMLAALASARLAGTGVVDVCDCSRAVVTHSVTLATQRGWSKGLKPLTIQNVVFAMLFMARTVHWLCILYISDMTCSPTLTLVSRFGLFSVRHSWAMRDDVKSSGRLWLPRASEIQATLVMFWAH
mmetsp:Transcript_22042/g.50360  ORF Transcript_22042/g.50360 Transcript_22042/m.50360 type:complete len:290 (-) Transcript_22042:924-1793(-)